MKASRITNSLLISFAVVIIFIYGKNLIVPFVLALILWFLIKEIRDLLNKVPYIKNKIPNPILNFLGFAVIFAVLGAVAKILSVNIQQLSDELPQYQANISKLTKVINANFNIDIVTSIKEMLGKFEYTNALSTLFNSITEIFGNALLILIYTIFLLLEEKFFATKIQAIYTQSEDQDDFQEILKKIDKSIGNYISVKTLTSLLTGFLSYIAMAIIGIEAPLFWAFLIFILNYIPTIGSLIATTFPAVFAMLQFGEVMPGIWVLIIVGAIQLIVGNYLDPKLTGNTLNVSPLIVILGLAFWGAIWGIIGMFLSVPITVMIIIILSEFPATQPIAILLTKNGNVVKKKRRNIKFK
jgi:predicted PurR-regulated permease PerM